MSNTTSIEQEIYEEYRRLINEDLEGNREGALALKESMERSPLYFRNRCTAKTLQIPKVFSKETINRFRKIGETAYDIFVKVINEYRANSEFRALFDFPPFMDDLILSPPLCSSPLPMTRFDIFYHSDTGEFKFCEVNTDGTSGMNEDRLLGELITENPAHQEIIRKYPLKQFELFDSWVSCFLRLYKDHAGTDRLPDIAIVDFTEGATLREFQEFQRRFQTVGARCEICDPRDMTYRDGRLYSGKGHIIDAVYRRAVTSDVMKHAEEIKPFLQAAREGAFFMAGDFRTQVIHNKMLFHVLRLPAAKDILTPQENAFVEAHIPRTVPFSDEFIGLNEVIENKDLFILKPRDSYASNGVLAGVEHSEDEWAAMIPDLYGTDYLCQDYCPQYSTENIDFAWGDGTFRPYINMSGLYMYDGQFSGIYSRMAEGRGIIASHRNERSVPTFVL